MIRVQSLFIIHPFHSVLRCATILHAVRHSAHPVLSSKQGKHLQHPYQCTQNTTKSNKFNLILFECWVSIEAKEIAIGNRTLSAHTIAKQQKRAFRHLQHTFKLGCREALHLFAHGILHVQRFRRVLVRMIHDRRKFFDYLLSNIFLHLRKGLSSQ